MQGRWAVSTDSDRIGARLDRVGDDALLQRADGLELPTEGVALGSIQVPPSGQPVIFLADHPITGGYPVVGVVTDADIDRLGQARPGQQIRFTGI
jgi:allophanate hydrolase subunit 2